MFTNFCKHESDKHTACANLKVAIVGGSLGGLATANVFHRLGASVTVFEKQSSSLEKRGACLGFVDVKLWERIRGARMTWPDGSDVTRIPPPDGRQSFQRQGSFYYGDMWQYLYSGLPNGCVKFGCQVHTLGDDPNKPTIDGEEFDLAVIADGGWSTLRDKYVETLQRPQYSGYQIFWSRVDAEDCGAEHLKSFDGRTELIGPYAAVTLPVPYFDGRKVYMCAFFVPTPEEEVRQPGQGDNRQIEQTAGDGMAPAWFVPFVKHLFGRNSAGARRKSPLATHDAGDEMVRFTEAAAARGKITAHPVFEFGVSKTVAGRIVIMGDAAHMASPMTAAGAHVAMQDALALWDVFVSGADDVDAALRTYDKGGIQRTKSLLRTSRAVSSDLVPRKHAVQSPATLLSEHHTDTTNTAPQTLRLF